MPAEKRVSTKGKNAAARVTIPTQPPPPPEVTEAAPPRQDASPRLDARVPTFRGGRGRGEAGGRTGSFGQGRGQDLSVRSPSPRVVSASDQEYQAGFHKLSTLVRDRKGANESDAYGHEEEMTSPFFQNLLHVPETLRFRGF